MLTKVSNDLIHHFLGKSDIKSLMKDPLIRQLFNSLQPSYKNSEVKTSKSYGSYPDSNFIATSLSEKLSQRNNILTLRWTTIGNHRVQNILHIYLSPHVLPDGLPDGLPNTELLVRAISFITAYSDRPRKITIHLCLLSAHYSLNL